MRYIFQIIAFVIITIFIYPSLGQLLPLNSYQEQLQAALKAKDNGKIAYYSYELAKLYEEESRVEDAMNMLEQSIAHAKKSDDTMMAFLATQRLGAIFSKTKNHSKALDQYQKALKLARALNKTEFINESHLSIAEVYASLNRHKKSIEAVEQVLPVALRQNDLLLQQKCYELLVSYYKASGNANKSKEYESLHQNLIKSLQADEQNEQQRREYEQRMHKVGAERKNYSTKLAQQNERLVRVEDSLLATRYFLESTEQSLREAQAEKEKQQMQIDLLSKDKELAEMRISEQNIKLENEALIRNSVIVGLLLASTLVLVIVNSYRKTLKANKKIAEQNKSIKSSINYAKRIQEAMLTKQHLQETLLPESFILFKPRDTVSGDFYWFSEIKSWYNPDVVFAAVDCTGHGIPGALMSMIGINALNGIISRGVAESDQILDALHNDIRTALQQETTGNNDGMDMALCIYRKEKNMLEYAGAKNPLVYIQNNQLHQIKGDVHSIGGSKSKKNLAFKKHYIPIEEPTMIYLFSDGYRDQFGGKDNMKFMSKRFNQLLLDIHHLPLEEQHVALEKAIEEWKGDRQQTDDILVMGIRLESTAID